MLSSSRLVKSVPAALLLFALSLPLPAAAKGLQFEIKEWRLDNGLRVIFAPHRRVPAVTVQVWYHVGSKNENPGIRGSAHMFEHMMFKGSKHVPPEEHARMISALGGSNNAFTAQDVTAYHNMVPKQYLEFALKLEAERMRYLHLSESTIQSEREVVKEEKRMRMENSPIGRALEAMYDLAYTKHPYSWTPAGDIPDLNRMTIQQFQSFYDAYYLPNNAALIVVGDVEEAQVRQAVARQFGAMRRGPEPPRVTLVEPPQSKLRKQLADWPSQLKVILGAYHIPAASHPDMPALRVLCAILSAGRSSRLNQALVRKGRMALFAGGFVQPQEHPGLLMTYAVGLPVHDLDRMQGTLLAEVDQLARVSVRPKELAKVKSQLATRALMRLQTLSGLAHQIGESTYLRGDPRAFMTDAEQLDRVTAAAITRVAKTYLTQRNLNLVILDTPAGKPAARQGGRP